MVYFCRNLKTSSLSCGLWRTVLSTGSEITDALRVRVEREYSQESMYQFKVSLGAPDARVVCKDSLKVIDKPEGCS